MISILVVEDDQEKLMRVTSTLLEVRGCSIEQIENARDVASAKRLLRDRHFDLLILDISIPGRADQPPDREGGAQLLGELVDRDLYRRPSHIVGLTAYDDSELLAGSRFRNEALAIVRYDPASTQWSNTLKRKVEHVLLSAREGEPQEYDADVCVVTALEEPELGAVLGLDWDWKQVRAPGDGTIYHEGAATSGTRAVRVFAAAAPRMGLTATAVLATKMILRFRPRYLVMAGIAAGVRNKAEVGDVLAADPCWNYEAGKRHTVDGARAFAPEPHQMSPDAIVRGSLAALARDVEALDEVRRGWRAQRISNSPVVRLGPVASGAAVLQDGTIVEEIIRQHRKTIGVEMESYALFVAAAEAPHPQPRAFSIKAVCDFADDRKDDQYQSYAAYVSASTLRLMVEKYLPF